MSERSIDLLSSSLSQATIKQYAGPLRQWADLCKEKGLDMFIVEPHVLIEFLTERFEQGARYGTINSCRSAISLITKEQIGSHPDVVRFMKGV